MGRRCALALAVVSALLCQVSCEVGSTGPCRQVGCQWGTPEGTRGAGRARAERWRAGPATRAVNPKVKPGARGPRAPSALTPSRPHVLVVPPAGLELRGVRTEAAGVRQQEGAAGKPQLLPRGRGAAAVRLQDLLPRVPQALPGQRVSRAALHLRQRRHAGAGRRLLQPAGWSRRRPRL